MTLTFLSLFFKNSLTSVIRVFALDLRCTPPKWAPRLGRYDWMRFAARTSPPLPGQEYEKLQIPIPWPKHEKPQPPPSM